MGFPIASAADLNKCKSGFYASGDERRNEEKYVVTALSVRGSGAVLTYKSCRSNLNVLKILKFLTVCHSVGAA